MELNRIINDDCLNVLKKIESESIDLVVTDPPYLIKNTKAGGKSEFAKSIQKMNDEIKQNNLTDGVDLKFCEELIRVCKKPNIYIFCNKAQIMDYLDFFVKEKGCSFDILIWKKKNAPPTFNNKYLTDKEYCLYFRKGGYCQPERYDDAGTVFFSELNVKDKKRWGHPTIKPLPIIERLIKNSSKEGDLILDPFSGSGTTAIACVRLKRNFICIEKNETFYKKSIERLEAEKKQGDLF